MRISSDRQEDASQDAQEVLSDEVILEGVVGRTAHVRGLVGKAGVAAAEAAVGVQRGRGEREREDEGGESVDHDDSRRAKRREGKRGRP